LGVKGLDPAIEKMHACKIDCVQLVAYKFLENLKYKPAALTRERAEAIGEALKKGGISVGLVGAYFNPVHSDKQKVAACKQIFKDYLTYSSVLGCNIVGSETGSFNDDKWTYNPLNRTDEALKTVVATFTELADYAKSVGAYVAMEGAAGHVCWKPSVLKRAVDEIDRDNVRFIFDLSHSLAGSPSPPSLALLAAGLKLFAGKIVVFHMKDFIVEDGKVKQVPPGKGMFDYPAILKKIKEYDKNAVLVLEGTTGEDIVPCAKFVKDTWNSL